MTGSAVQSLKSMISQPAELEVGELASLEEQLVAFYGEMEYLQQNFPNQSIRSVVDLAKSLQSKLIQNQSANAQALGFVPPELVAKLGNLDQATADAFDFGIVEMDDNGAIRIYNRWEQQLAGVTLQNALGKNFFLDIAPCTNNRLFLGRFRQGVQTGALDVSFNYTFTYKIKPTSVSVIMYRDNASQKNYVFVKKR